MREQLLENFHLLPPPLAVFETALAHEQGVSERINKIVDIALAEHAHHLAVFDHRQAGDFVLQHDDRDFFHGGVG